MFATTVRAVEVGGRRRRRAEERPIVAHVNPQPTGLGPTQPWSQHRDSRVVAVDLLCGEDVAADRRHDRIEQPGRLANPVAQGRAVQFDPLAGVDLALTIQRQASRAGEFHPRALPEPYVNLSAHTAPSVRPWPYRSGQWANRSGDDRTTRASQFRAPFGCCLRRLNLRRAHRMRKTSIRRNVGYNADL